jgi:hypothetical protein
MRPRGPKTNGEASGAIDGQFASTEPASGQQGAERHPAASSVNLRRPCGSLYDIIATPRAHGRVPCAKPVAVMGRPHDASWPPIDGSRATRVMNR